MSAAAGSSSSTDGGQSDLEYLFKFRKHVPSVLIKQLITKIVDRYMSRNTDVELSKPPHSFSCVPSIERFYGALLFVDISGFTVLSQKLSVDDLRLHINAYFTKILSTVYMYGGDVVKFAGDALFIVWPAEVQNPLSPEHKQSVKKAVACAVSCGLEVNATCANYAIPLEHSEPNITYLNVHSGVSVGTMAGMDVGANDRWEYLLFGSCLGDVAIAEGKAGKGDLVLSPLAGRIIHGSAPAAQLTACNCAVDADGYYTIFGAASTSKCHLHSPEHLCVHHDEDDFGSNEEGGSSIFESKVPTSMATYFGNAFMERKQNMIEEFKEEWRMFDRSVRGMSVASEQSSVTATDTETAAAAFTGGGNSSSSTIPVEHDGALLDKSFGDGDNNSNNNNNTGGTRANTPAEDLLFDHFINFCEKCLADDTGRHVHDVERDSYKFKKFLRTNAAAIFMQQYSSNHRALKFATAVNADHNPPLSLSSLTMNTVSSASDMNTAYSFSENSTGDSISTSFVGKLKASVTSGIFFENSEFAMQIKRSQHTPIKPSDSGKKHSIAEEKHLLHEKLLRNDASLSAELRNVIVLFISVQVPEKQLFMDNTRPLEDELVDASNLTVTKSTVIANSKPAIAVPASTVTSTVAMLPPPAVSPFFLPRTAAEISADVALLAQFQSCMEVLTHVCADTGGQMRQFIVDDKGTVAILTFGLKGSVGSDSAASAMEAAQQAIYGLQDLGYNASVGVTSGKVYCGPVGSIIRQEYAVMGPSTNLAARLMGKAKPGEIICDIAIRDRDRFHKFSSLAEVQAKGYANPVPIFKPNFGYKMSFDPIIMSKYDSDKKGSDLIKDAINAVTQLSTRTTLKLEMPTSSSSSLEDDMPPPQGVCQDIQMQTQQKSKSMSGGGGLKGREQEVDDIVAFIIPEIGSLLNTMNTSAVSTPIGHTPVHTAYRRGISVDNATRLAIIEGPVGIGKSSVLSAVRRTFRNVLLRKDAPAQRWNNYQIFTNRASVVVSLEPFSCWKPIIRTMLLSLRSFYMVHNNLASGSRGGLEIKKSVASSSAAASSRAYYKELSQAFEMVDLSLSDELRGLKFLLVSVHILRTSDEEEEEELRRMSAKLDVKERMNKTTQLLAGIMAQYVLTLDKMALIFIEDVQTIDSHSLDVLKKVQSSNTGLAFVVTLRSFGSTAQGGPEPCANTVTKGGLLNKDEGNRNNFCVGSLSDMALSEDRYKHIFLPALSYVSAKEYLNDLFIVAGITRKESVTKEAVFEKIYEISGGNPLYLYEMSKTLVDKFKAVGTVGDGFGEECTSFSNLVENFKIDRIEEVIFYRFDQLSTTAQLLLKMAAVFCANGGTFNIPCLLAMEKGNLEMLQVSNSDEKLASIRAHPLVLAVLDMVKRGEFVRIVPSIDRNRSRSTSMIQPEPIALYTGGNDDEESYNDSESQLANLIKSTFEFMIEIERVAIYDIMLADQKESLHDRVACCHQDLRTNFSFSSSRGSSEKSSSIKLHSEEAFHWEKCKYWSNALNSYYLTAVAMESLGSYEDSFEQYRKALRMFFYLKQDAGISHVSYDDLIVPIEERRLMSTTISREEAAHASALTRTDLSKEDVRQMFNGDPVLMQTALQSLLKFGQAAWTLHAVAIPSMLRVFEEALQIISLTWDTPFMAQIKFFTAADLIAVDKTLGNVAEESSSMERFSHAGAHFAIIENDLEYCAVNFGESSSSSSSSSDTATKESGNDDGFKLRDPAITFPILSGIAALYRSGAMPDDDNKSMQRAIYDIIVNLAQTDVGFKTHALQGLCLTVGILFDQNNVELGMKKADDVVRIYNPSIHHMELVSHYGNDRAVYTIVRYLQILVMTGLWQKFDHISKTLVQITPEISHFHSYGLIALGLCPVMKLLNRSHEAHRFFKSYTDLEAKREDAYSFFRDTNPYFSLCWALDSQWCRAVELNEFTVIRSVLGDEYETELLKQTEKDVTSGKVLADMTKAGPRVILNVITESFGSSVEYACANICFIRAQLLHIRYTIQEFRYSTSRDAEEEAAVAAAGSGLVLAGEGKSTKHLNNNNNNETSIRTSQSLRCKEVQRLLLLSKRYIEVGLSFVEKDDSKFLATLLLNILKAQVFVFGATIDDTIPACVEKVGAGAAAEDVRKSLIATVMQAEKLHFPQAAVMLSARLQTTTTKMGSSKKHQQQQEEEEEGDTASSARSTADDEEVFSLQKSALIKLREINGTEYFNERVFPQVIKCYPFLEHWASELTS